MNTLINDIHDFIEYEFVYNKNYKIKHWIVIIMICIIFAIIASIERF